jgi:iron complex transport system ATP-binding protein
MIKAENITVSVGSKVLLNDVSAVFEGGKMNLIIGPNGAGKSTLIKVLCKQMKHAAGRVFYGSQEIDMLSDEYLSRIRSVLSQNIDLAFPLTVWEVVMLGRYPHFISKPGPKDEKAVEETMRYFDVWDMAKRNYLTLSGGEKQRVHFARVLSQIWYASAGQPRYLFLDEPLTFLDIHYQFEFMHKLVSLLKDSSLVVIGVVHDLNLAARFADTLLLLNKGSVLAHGEPRSVLTKENILKSFQLEPVIHQPSNGKSFYVMFE